MSPAAQLRIPRQIAAEIGARPEQVTAAVALLDEGATVPFVARYRKEVTGGLDDTQLRNLAERLSYLREMEARRAAILDSIAGQGKLTDDLAKAIGAAETKAVLEDLYLPYKPKRRTKAMIARENGLEPLAEAILADRTADPEALAAGYLSEAVPDGKAALEGAREIVAERLVEDAGLKAGLRAHMAAVGRLTAEVMPGKEAEGAKFSDYFAHSEALSGVPSHRALAMFRGRNEGFLALDLAVEPEAAPGQSRAEAMVRTALNVGNAGKADQWLGTVAGWVWRVKLKLSLTIDLMTDLREKAEAEAIRVFARNLKDLLLAAPAGAKATMGLDPGIRTGVKVAVVDPTGKLLETATVYPFQPRMDVQGTLAVLGALVRKHGVGLIAIGNGTASRETDALVAELLSKLPSPRPVKVVVSEAGASVYSASELAAREFPDLDVSLRGAVSIARRLQDPLAELVKIEPKAIGVGQYQHDVNQSALGRALDGVVEDAVNAVGVELNTASAPLLARVSGLGPGLAEAVVAHRDANGPFAKRRDLLKVARLGPKAFEQAAGFLRIRGGSEPLDASSVHPEAYDLARKIVKAAGKDVAALMKEPGALKRLEPRDFTDETFGLPTVKDIMAELEKPGRDPRPEFKTATFAEGVNEIRDLKPGMRLEGTVTNVAAFGAFVDIGVHQDGLVHVSQLADRFVKDPHEVVKAGDVVSVRVVEVDVARKRIGLTMRKDNADTRPQDNMRDKGAPKGRGAPPPRSASAGPAKKDDTGAFGAALLDALKKR
ncbi:Tex family protein [Pararhodobacter aggregans]|uniref:Small ribosomal subunit protein bS1 n=1 Tax=Pararhodobacter aggregans TaxID=404875 RepID=A0A2T7UNA7_9RHOB|nr:Tex family protein [Pararhodobacter aggregans]PVE46195.1 RNA-binding transcriptional accessory protein [Pararhodobacter aggregans]